MLKLQDLNISHILLCFIIIYYYVFHFRASLNTTFLVWLYSLDNIAIFSGFPHLESATYNYIFIFLDLSTYNYPFVNTGIYKSNPTSLKVYP